MNFTELKSYIAQNMPSGIFIIQGDDAFLREKAVQIVAEKTVTAFPELNIINLDSNVTIHAIRDASFSLPLLSEKKIIIIKEFYPKKQEAEALKKFNLNDNTHSVLIISNSLKSELDKLLSSQSTFIDCSKQEIYTLASWIGALLRAKNLTITRDAAEKLSEYCGRDMSRITMEIEKLSFYCQGSVTIKDIDDIVAKDTEYQVYMLSNMVTKGEGEKAFAMIADFSKKGDSGYIQMFLTMLFNHYKRMYYVKTSKLGEDALAKKLKIKPYAVKMLKKDSARLSDEYLKNAIKTISDADYNIKSGKAGGDVAIKYVLSKLLKGAV